MNRREFLSAGLVGAGAMAIGTTPVASALAATGSGYRLTGPYAHKNLALYLIHRADSGKNAVPLTLEEAMKAGAIEVVETGAVSRLIVRNPGDREIFIQAGDIVKGGKQDRVLAVSMVVSPKSGDIPIGAYCVEQGRWAQRGAENLTAFSVSTALIPSRAAKLAMRAPALPFGMEGQDLGNVQGQVWGSVSNMQRKLAVTMKRTVADKRSRSSLQLSLENKALGTAVTEFEEALGGLPEKHPDAVGYVFAIGGRINSGDEFESAGLFRKLWQRQLRAAATEALAESSSGTRPSPSQAQVTAFIDGARAAQAVSKAMPGGIHVVTGQTKRSLFTETRRGGDRWVHRSFVSKH